MFVFISFKILLTTIVLKSIDCISSLLFLLMTYISLSDRFLLTISLAALFTIIFEILVISISAYVIILLLILFPNIKIQLKPTRNINDINIIILFIFFDL